MKQGKIQSFYVVTAISAKPALWYLWSLNIWIFTLHPLRQERQYHSAQMRKTGTKQPP